MAAIGKATVLAVGPGLGGGLGVTETVTALLTSVRSQWCSMRTDSTSLAPTQPLFAVVRRSWSRRIPVNLPACSAFRHADLIRDRETQSSRVCRQFEVVLVLKGHETLVTDGRRLYRNTTGNPGMATGGSGDVLTGLIAALIGQGLDAFAAAQLGVHLHGLAGDFARDELGRSVAHCD